MNTLCTFYFFLFIYTDDFQWRIIMVKVRKLCGIKKKERPEGKGYRNSVADMNKKTMSFRRANSVASRNQGNIQYYFRASLSIEIIYTVLNAVT